MNKSFTLIEILVVIVVVGILSAFIIVSMAGVSSKANIAKSQAFANSLRNSLLLNLVSEWKLDGNGNDSWGSNNGTVNGATSYSNCIQGTCYSFNGTSNFIEVPYNSNLKPTEKITFSVWASMTDWYSAADRRIISCTESGGYNITLSGNSGTAWVYINGGYRTPAFYATAPSSGWHFFLATYTGRYFKTYFDGVYQNQFDAGATYPIAYAHSNSFIIGGEAGTSTGCAGNYFAGIIDTVNIYNEAMPSSGVGERYYSGLNKLFKNNEITLNEFNQKISELKLNLADNE
ncbi:MAG: LamG domain-containing protein [Candidatus Paceibacterota bacterium]|jgi:prepilin-type N-terminal cleavage/methylation domain-containing protein